MEKHSYDSGKTRQSKPDCVREPATLGLYGADIFRELPRFFPRGDVSKPITKRAVEKPATGALSTKTIPRAYISHYAAGSYIPLFLRIFYRLVRVPSASQVLKPNPLVEILFRNKGK